MKRWTLVLVLLAVAGLASASSSTPRPRLTLELLRSTADSAWVKATLDSRDARGNPVHHYDAALTRAAIGDTSIFWQAQVFANVTGLGTATIAMARPLAGDTVRLWLDASATDSRGSTSGFARSATLVIGTPWSPPAPPTITIDTVAYEPGTPDGLTMYVAPPTWGGMVTISGDQLAMAVGDTVTICALRWTGGYATTPAEPVKWSTDRSDAVLLEPRTSNCALATALLETSLGVAPWPTRMARP